MKQIILTFALLTSFYGNAQVAVGTTTADASAALDVVSTTKGFLPPRMTQAQRTAIGSPATGLMVFQTDGTAGLYYYSGTAWIYIINGSTATLPLASGGTGATTAAGARTALGAAASGANTDITSLAPASAGTINNMAIGGTTPAAAAFTTVSATGSITGITEGVSENSTKMASTAFVSRALTNAGGGYTLGDFKLSAQTADHGSWLICDGRAVSRSTYASLFTLIGVAYGAGDGSTTFNLPDLRGRVPGGVGQGAGLSSRARGATAGAETTVLSTAQLPAHNHTASVSTDGWHTHISSMSSSGDHQHQQGSESLYRDYGGGQYTGDRSYPGGGAPSYKLQNTSSAGIHTHSITINADGNHSHTVTINNTGSGNAVSLMQPTLFAGNYFIYTGQ